MIKRLILSSCIVIAALHAAPPKFNTWQTMQKNDGNATIVERVEKDGYGNASIPLMDLKKGSVHQLIVKGRMAYSNVNRGEILLTGYDYSLPKDKQAVFWSSVTTFSGNKDMDEFSFPFLVPASVGTLNVAFRLWGIGELKFHEAALEEIPLTKLTPGLSILQQSWMARKDGKLPNGWKEKFWLANECHGEFDNSGNGLMLTYRSGGARFGVEAPLYISTAPPGTVISFETDARTMGDGKVQLMAEFFKGEKTLGDKISSPFQSSSLMTFRQDFTVPEGTDAMHFYLVNGGKGSVQFLRARIGVIEPDKKRQEYPMSVYASPAEGNRLIFGKEIFHTFQEHPLPLSFDFWGDKSKLKNMAFVLEMPSQIQLKSIFSTHFEFYRGENAQIEKISRGGKEYTRYTVKDAAAFRYIEPAIRWKRQLAAGIDGPIGEYQLYFYVKDDNGKGPEKNMILSIRPPMQLLPNPKDFFIVGWADDNIHYPEEALFRSALACFEEANIRGKLMSYKNLRHYDQICREHGDMLHLSLQDYTLSRNYRNGGQDLPEVRYLVNAAGNTYKPRLCSEYYCENLEFRKVLGETFRHIFENEGVQNGDWAFMDHEPHPVMDGCFCDACIQAFRNSFGITQNLTAADIMKNHRAEWGRFRTQQTARVNRLTVQLLKAVNPNIHILDYDYIVPFGQPAMKTHFENHAKDSRLYEDCIEGHMISYYHVLKKAAFESIDLQVKNLKQPVIMTPSLSRNDLFQSSYTTDEETQSPSTFRQTILAGATAGCTGICIYPGSGIDGLFLESINQSMAEVAYFEETFRKGKRIEDEIRTFPCPNRIVPLPTGEIRMPDWKEFFAFRAYQDGDGILLALFNYHKREKLFLRLEPSEKVLKQGTYEVSNPCRQLLYCKRDKRLFTRQELGECMIAIEPEDVVFIRILPSSQTKASSFLKVDVDDTEQEYNKQLSKSEGASFKPFVIGDTRAELTDKDGDGFPEVTLQKGNEHISISTRGGCIQSWFIDASELTISKADPIKGGLLWDWFLLPSCRYTTSQPAYELVTAKEEKGMFAIQLKYAFQGKDIAVAKKLLVAPSLKNIAVEYSFTNLSNEKKEISFWTHNILPKDTVLEVDGKTVEKKPSEQFIPLSGKKLLLFPEDRQTGTAVSCDILAKIGRKSIIIDLPEASMRQLYFYQGNFATAEAMTEPFAIPPKEKHTFSFSFGLSLN